MARSNVFVSLVLPALLAAMLFACPEPVPVDQDAGHDAGTIIPPGGDAGADGGRPPDAGTHGGTDAGTDGGAEQRLGWGNLQWPPYATLGPGGSITFYGQVWMEGVTPGGGAGQGIEAEAGFGPVGSDPASGQWTWTPATFNKDEGNNDEYMAAITAPASGQFDYAFRYRHQGGAWLYADRSDEGRAGTNDGYQSPNAGKLAVRESGGTFKVATLNLHCLNDDAQARLDAAAQRLSELDVDAVALQEVCEDTAMGAAIPNSAAYLAQKLSGARTYEHLFVQTHLAFNVTPEGVGIVYAAHLAGYFVKDLPTGDFARKTQVALLATDVGIVALSTVHFSFRSEDAQVRLQQAQTVTAALAAVQPAPAVSVVAGDFNTIPGTAPIDEMVSSGYTDAWAAKFPSDPGFTHRSDNPTRRIDYVFVRDVATTPVVIDTVSREFTQPYAGTAYVSDHIGVFAEVRVP